jgi:allantoin racemase
MEKHETMNIEIITPIIRKDEYDSVVDVYQKYASPGTVLNIDFIDEGPESIESEYDSALAAPEVLRLSKRAEENGMQAIIIDCMGDVGLYAARELVNIPVIGPAQASMSLAATLADRFSVIGVLERDRSAIHDIWRRYDLTGRGTSVRVVNIPVLSLHDDDSQLVEAITEQAILAISEDGAQAIVLGCTGMGGKFAREVQSGLEEAGYAGVPVIDPTGVALKLAESLVTLGISHSKLTFPKPPIKQIKGYKSHRIP